ncbi:MAG: Ig-like domain repeat protein [Acidimicrobiales bacterium]
MKKRLGAHLTIVIAVMLAVVGSVAVLGAGVASADSNPDCTTASPGTCQFGLNLVSGSWSVLSSGDTPNQFPSQTTTTLTGDEDFSSGTISNATLTLPSQNVCSSAAGGCTTFAYTEVNPGTATGTFNLDGQMTLTDTMMLTLNVTTPITATCVSTPIPMTFTTTSPYNLNSNDVTISSSGFDIPDFTGTPDDPGSCGLAQEPLNSGQYPYGVAGSTNNNITLNLNGTLSLGAAGIVPTTTVVAVNPTPGVSGQPVSLAAGIFKTNGGGPAGDATGTIAFFATSPDGTEYGLGTASVQGGSAQLSTGTTPILQQFGSQALPFGNMVLTAVYSGDTNYSSSTSAGLDYTVDAPPAEYVAQAGSDTDNNCQDQSNPCATITHAIDGVPGQTIYVSGTIEDTITDPPANAYDPGQFDDLTISGAGAPTNSPAIVETQSSGAIFNFGSGTHVTLDDLSIDGTGFSGSGIENIGATVNVINCTLSGDDASGTGTNSGGSAVNNITGTVNITDSLVTDNTVESGSDAGQGAIANSGTATITNSTISNNTGQGGGISVTAGSTLTVVGSTISGNLNDPTYNTGGYGVSGPGGGEASITITDSTIANNQSTAISGAGGAILTSDTIVGNGNGLSGDASIGASILADNGDPSTCPDWNFTSVGYNLTDEDSSCFDSQSTDIVDTDPDVGALSDNGGPTFTMLPASDSPTVAQIPTGTTLNGVSVCPGTDQRGVSRPQPSDGSACTIGSVEVAPLASPTITSGSVATFDVGGPAGSFTVDSYANPTASLTESGPFPVGVTFTDNGDGTATIAGTPATQGTYPITITAANSQGSTTQSFTLYAAKNAATYYVAQGGTDAGTCSFSSNPCATLAYALTQIGPGDTIDVSGSIQQNVTITIPATIAGGSSVQATVDGSGASQAVFVITPGLQVNLDNLVIENGSYQFGAGIYNAGSTLAVANSTITDNSAGFAGGGVLNQGTMTLDGDTISDNTGALGAGGINNGGTLIVENSTIADNSTPAQGGGGLVNSGVATVTNSTIADNSAGSEGGGVLNAGGGTMTIGATIIADNSGGNCGGTAPTSEGYNLTDDTTSAACGMQPVFRADLVDVEPDLGPLGNNGGPTATEAPASDSPAVGDIPATATGNPDGVALCPSTDQRGVARPGAAGGKCTIGAVELAPSQGKLTASPKKGLVYGQSVTLTDTLSSGVSAPALPVPTGAVTFSRGDKNIVGCISVPVSATGNATCTTSSLKAGTNRISATYSATNGYLGQTATLSYQELPASTTVEVTSSHNPAVVNQKVTYTASVSTVAPGVGTATGGVTFSNGDVAIKGCSGVAVTSAGTASCTTSYPKSGVETVNVSYGGSNNFNASSSQYKETVKAS